MVRRRRPTLLVLGPSGAGKSSLGAHLAAAGFLHVEYDTAQPGDFAVALQPGLDALRKRSRIGALLVELEAIEARHPVPGTVITFESRMTLEPRNVAAIERAGDTVARGRRAGDALESVPVS